MTNEAPRVTTAPVVDAIVQLSFTVLDVLAKSSAENGLSVTQLRLLGILRDRTPSMAALADYLGLDRSSVSGLIDRAEHRGLVARRTSSDDARVTIIDLTEHGAELAGQLAATVSRRMEKMLESVTPANRSRLVQLAESIIRSGTVVDPWVALL